MAFDIFEPWSAVVALADVSRRTLYEYVRHAGHPVTREEAAEAAAMSRGLAAFHLDKLVDAGLLTARHEAPPDQPRGRGRTPKVYEPAAVGLAVTIPARRYELVAEILADAVASHPADAERAARRNAHQRGMAVGSDAEGGDLLGALDNLGFEPRPAADGRILLHNCPFHALARRQTELVCTLNLAFITGLVEGLGDSRVRTALVPRAGACCVELDPR
jgi:predicted ArsR family transcriptional regulator